MIALPRLAPAALLLVAAVPAGPADRAGSYAVRIAIMPGSGSQVQRLSLPAAALAAARTRDLADVRVLDARGRAMPMARLRPARDMRRDTLRAMPILGAADALKVSGVSLQLDGGGGARVARVDGTVVDGGPPVVLGVLFDARALTGAAHTLTLDADVPAGQPVTFVAEASRDLSTWRPLGEKVVYRVGEGARADAAIPLGQAALRGDYLRVTWRLGSRALSPVGVRAATLASEPGDPAPAWAEATLPPGAGGRTIDVALPFAAPVSALSIRPVSRDLLVPVRILGRDDAEQPWTLLGQGVAARSTGSIVLTGGGFRLLRIEADARSPGFTAAPALRIGFAPADVVFLAAGAAPFTLAVGRAGDAGRFLPAATLMAEGGGRGPATATTVPAPARVALASAEDPRRGGRQVLLWGVLLGAAALLAALAWHLARRRPDAPAHGE